MNEKQDKKSSIKLINKNSESEKSLAFVLSEIDKKTLFDRIRL